ncbi:hypothetical protein LPJ59_007056, partial [Coemansia sp. RSA 2399]
VVLDRFITHTIFAEDRLKSVQGSHCKGIEASASVELASTDGIMHLMIGLVHMLLKNLM